MENHHVRKEEIRTAARKLFFTFGLNKTSMEDIAGETGIAKPTLYYYYQSKEELFNEIVNEEVSRFLEKVITAIPENLPADEKFRHFSTTVFKEVSSHIATFENRTEYFCKSSPHGEPLLETLNTSLEEYIKSILSEGIDQGIFKISDLDMTYKTIIFMTSFIKMKWIKKHPEELKNQIFSHMLDLLINGLKGETHA